MQLLLSPAVSVALKPTAVTPTENNEPLAGPATCPTAATNPQLSVAVAASKKIGAEHVDATAFAVMFPGHTAPATPKQHQPVH